MLTIDIPGWTSLTLEHLVLDFNGTLARDGKLLPGVRERLNNLGPALEIHVLTADTFGSVQDQMRGIACAVSVIPASEQARAKAAYLEKLGPSGCVAVGNGRNDVLMLEAAALGIALLQEEGAAPQTLAAADVVCRSVCDALDLLTHPLRLSATLRG
ncbi:Soluble P-type ATPase [Desulfonatronum zhilinae]|nr:Soluble P-type ATPase [Desulfonatronum zhilinae]